MSQILQFSKALRENEPMLSGILVLKVKRDVQQPGQFSAQKAAEKPKKTKFEFPRPTDMPVNDGGFFCHTKRILEIYSKHHGRHQKRMTNPVKSWFQEEANRQGWGHTEFLTDVQSKNCAGCMLYRSCKGESRVAYH